MILEPPIAGGAAARPRGVRELDELAASVSALIGRTAPGRVALVAITGSVASGKSTLADQLRVPLARALGRAVDVLGTDGFLLADAELTRRGLFERKGFPETHDWAAIEGFVAALARGPELLHAPVYCHKARGVIGTRLMRAPAVLLLEGVVAGEILRRTRYPDACLIYLHAAAADVERWYVSRYCALRADSDARPGSAVAEEGRKVWCRTNLPNLLHHILPHRARADVTVHKHADHSLGRIEAGRRARLRPSA